MADPWENDKIVDDNQPWLNDKEAPWLNDKEAKPQNFHVWGDAKSGLADFHHYTFPSGDTFTAPKSSSPESIRGELGTKGYSPEDIDKAFATKRERSFWKDDPTAQVIKSYGKTAVSKAAQGFTDFPDAITSYKPMYPMGLGGSGPNTPKTPHPIIPSPGPVVGKAIEPYLHKAEYPGEEIFGEGIRGIPQSILAPTARAATAISNVPRMVPWAAKTLNYGVLPGAAAEAAGEGVQKTAESVPEGIKPYIKGTEAPIRMGTALFSPFATRRMVTPNTITNPIVAQRYRTAKEGGVTPSAAQLFKDPRMTNEELASNPMFNQQQKDAYNRSITSATGEPTESITGGSPDSYLGRNFRRIGSETDRLERTTAVNPNTPGGAPRRNPQIYNDLVNIATANPHHVPEIVSALQSVNPRFRPTNYPNSVITPQEAIHDAIFRTAPGGTGTYTLPGNEYKQLRTALHTAAESAPNPQVAHSLRQTAEALDNAMEAGLPTNRRGEWDRNRRQYANALVLQDAIGGQGAGARQITPDQFKSSSERVMGREPYLRRELERNAFNEAAGEFKPLKKTKLPDKPTAAQTVMSYVPYGQHILAAAPLIGGVGGALAGYHLGWGHAGALESGVLGYLMGEGGRKLATMPSPYKNATNPLVQMYRKNQLLPEGGQTNAAIARALLENSRGSDQ